MLLRIERRMPFSGTFTNRSKIGFESDSSGLKSDRAPPKNLAQKYDEQRARRAGTLTWLERKHGEKEGE
jgi:hypothetical protein